nr:MAG TPA: hypothetical protein [Caudoviricetes sp.]
MCRRAESIPRRRQLQSSRTPRETQAQRQNGRILSSRRSSNLSFLVVSCHNLHVRKTESLRMDMMDWVAVFGPAALSAVVGAGSAVLTFYAQITNRLTKLETKMDDLDSKVDKHNSVIERTFILEGKVDQLVNHQI